jgi:hypothetical protein
LITVQPWLRNGSHCETSLSSAKVNLFDDHRHSALDQARFYTGDGEMNSIGERLRVGMDRKSVSTRSLRDELKAKGVKGATLPSISSYLSNRATPPVEFIHAAAAALGVRAAWLAFGDGQITEPEDRVARGALSKAIGGSTALSAERSDDVGERIVRSIEECFPLLKRASESVHIPLIRLWGSYFGWVDSGGYWGSVAFPLLREGKPGEHAEKQRLVGRMIGKALNAPLGYLHVEPWGWAVDNYILCAVQAMMALLMPTGPMRATREKPVNKGKRKATASAKGQRKRPPKRDRRRA